MLAFALSVSAEDSKELEYQFDSDTSSYWVVGIGNFTGSDLIIPDEYMGYPVTKIEEKAFYNCEQIKSLVVSDNVTEIGEFAFHYCINLENVKMGNGVKIVGNSAFYFCTQLEELELGSVSTIEEYAFYNCTDINALVIPDTVTQIKNGAFKYCDNLIKLTVGSNVESIEDSAFEFCYKLFEVYNLSDCKIELKKETYGFVAKYATVLHTDIEEESVLDFTSDGCVFTCYDGKYCLVSQTGNETALVLPDYYNGNPYIINRFAFHNRTKLESITFGEGVYEIGPAAFNFCGGLVNVEIINGITEIGAMAFADCHNLENITLPESVESMGIATFQNCFHLKSVTVPSKVTVINANLFYGCKYLETVNFNSNLTEIGNYAFANCDKLTVVTLPEGLKTIGTLVFYNCEKLSLLYIPKSVENISEKAIYQCPALKIQCQAIEKPENWHENWNVDSRPVEWGYNYDFSHIFVFLGYSTNGNSICAGYSLNCEAFKLYENTTGKNLDYGIVFASYELLNGQNPLDSQGNAIELNIGRVLKASLKQQSYRTYDFLLTDISTEIYNHPFVIAGYVFDGEKVEYIQEKKSDSVTGKSYNEMIGSIEENGNDGICIPVL